MVADPTARVELAHAAAFFAAHPGARSVVVIGLDEVGRGALAGPVMVGAYALTVRREADGAPLVHDAPAGVRDSKLVSAGRRDKLYAAMRERGALAHVGRASAPEIDDVGISAALTLAAVRALRGVREDIARREASSGEGSGSRPGLAAIILDGNLDYLTRGLEAAEASCPIDVRIKADRDCVSVAAASIVAKVERDRHMVALDASAPAYGWARNKGYGSAAHREALTTHGLHPEHRASWRLLPEPSEPSMEHLWGR